VFDLSLEKLLVLAVIALIVFGPHELPKIAQQAGKALRELRRIAEGATEDLKEGLGPEFQNFELDDLNPRRFVQKHLMDGAQPLFDEFTGKSGSVVNGSGSVVNGTAAAGTAVANGTRSRLVEGAEPPFDIEAT
jgi:sec-independent protein translocase protein TatB